MNLLYQRIGGHEGISKLLRHFYADVRQDPLIGPIFNAQIKDWKHHRLRNPTPRAAEPFVVLQRAGWKVKGVGGAAELLGVNPTLWLPG